MNKTSKPKHQIKRLHLKIRNLDEVPMLQVDSYNLQQARELMLAQLHFSRVLKNNNFIAQLKFLLGFVSKRILVSLFALVKLFFARPTIWVNVRIEQFGADVIALAKLSYQKIKQKVRDVIFTAQEGHLSYYFLFKLGIKNLIYSKSKTLVTTGAIALGSGAIVFLVSFAYGLQEIVTGRLIFPNATRIADVQSATTALALDRKSVAEISAISGVEAVVPAISAAGTLEYNNSKTDVVVIAAQNDYLTYSNYQPIVGTLFSAEANENYAQNQEKIDEIQDIISQAGEVLGTVQENTEIQVGDLIDGTTVRIRIKDDTYLPVRSSPTLDATIIGYVRGSIINSYQAQEVWGEVYQSAGATGRAMLDDQGNWLGKWVKAIVPLYQEQAPTVYVSLTKDNGEQLITEGYLPQVDLHLLSPEEIIIETQLDQISQEQGRVLGDATDSADTADTTLDTTDDVLTIISATSSVSSSSATTSSSLTTREEDLSVAGLSELLKSQQDQEEEQLKTSMAVVDVSRVGGKEILVSTGLLQVWDIEPQAIIGQNLNLEYILSGGVISGLAGKVISNSVSYVVVGVIQDTRSIVIAPLGEVESMGSDRFTSIKVLAKADQLMTNIRAHVESLGFTTQSLTDTLMQVNKLFSVMRFLLGLFGMIALVVAIFGMFNTLTISLLERTREIGVMKTLGTADADVLKLFMIESFLIGCGGGVLGIVLGAGLGFLINFFFNIFKPLSNVNLFSAPLGFMVFILLLSVAVGLLTGLYPSGRAKKIKALDALRYE